MRKAIFALAVAGIIDSALALQAHYGTNTQWDRSAVGHSALSTFGVVPVAAIGVAGYLLLALLAWFQRRGWTLLCAWIGLGFAAYLSYVEFYVLHAWSADCVISQCIIALIAILAAIDAGIAIAKKFRSASNAVDHVVNNLRYG